MSDNPQTYPVKPGDWVWRNGRPAQVRSIWWDNEPLADLILYDREGNKIGRESPAMGGPRSFEPACSLKNWERISPPQFPIRPAWVPTADGHLVNGWRVTIQPPRQYVKYERKRDRLPATRAITDYDPQLEAASRRMAAQFLRDMARATHVISAEDARRAAGILEAQADELTKGRK